MRILHISSSFYPNIGGIENYVLNLCQQLIERGHQSDVLTLRKRHNSKNVLKSHEKYRGIDIQRVSHLGPERYKIFPPLLKYLEDYDILHIHSVKDFCNYFALRKWLHKKPIVVSTHGGFFHTRKYRSIKKIYFRTILPVVLQHVDKVLAVSSHDYDMFRKICKHTILVQNGIDFRGFSQVNKNIQKNSFLYYGRISKNKRLDNLVKTFSYLKQDIPDFKLNIIGPDWEDLMERLQILVKNEGIENNVCFVGEVKNDVLLKYLETSQYFVSATEYEGFGLTVLEAMASQTIPIVNDINPINQFVKNGQNGYVVNFFKHKNSAEEIFNITKISSEKMKIISANAYNTAKEFSWEKVAEKIEDIYLQIIKSNQIEMASNGQNTFNYNTGV